MTSASSRTRYLADDSKNSCRPCFVLRESAATSGYRSRRDALSSSQSRVWYGGSAFQRVWRTRGTYLTIVSTFCGPVSRTLSARSSYSCRNSAISSSSSAEKRGARDASGCYDSSPIYTYFLALLTYDAPPESPYSSGPPTGPLEPMDRLMPNPYPN